MSAVLMTCSMRSTSRCRRWPDPPRPVFALRQELLNLVIAAEHPGSVKAIFGGLLRTGRAVRNHLGDDSWRLLNRLQQRIQEPPQEIGARQARELLEEELMLVAAFSSLNNETMPHHQGWLFFDVGRYLERVLRTLDLFKLAFITARNPGLPLWEVVLTITDNLTAYRRRYRSALHPTAIIDLLLFDEGNPVQSAISYGGCNGISADCNNPAVPLPQRRRAADS